MNEIWQVSADYQDYNSSGKNGAVGKNYIKRNLKSYYVSVIDTLENLNCSGELAGRDDKKTSASGNTD